MGTVPSAKFVVNEFGVLISKALGRQARRPGSDIPLETGMSQRSFPGAADQPVRGLEADHTGGVGILGYFHPTHQRTHPSPLLSPGRTPEPLGTLP